MPDRIHEFLDVWFGYLGTADLPSSDRTNLWFGDNNMVKDKIFNLFQKEYDKVVSGDLMGWEESPRGRLALIILCDQFPRYVHQKSAHAFLLDEKARSLTLAGLEKNVDQSLTLIERVFFYMPLVHAEDSALQEKSIRLYQNLVALSLTETTQIYQLFLAYAYAHFRVIQEFGRFPQRNHLLGRESTPSEVAFLKEM